MPRNINELADGNILREAGAGGSNPPTPTRISADVLMRGTVPWYTKLNLVAPDGKSRARIKTYRNHWYLVWCEEDKTRRRTLRTKNREVAIERALALCGNTANRTLTDEEKSPEWWMKQRIRSARDRAKRKNLRFDLTLDDLMTLYERSQGRCEVSGIPFDLTKPTGDGNSRPWRLSLDQIDPGVGYVPSNLRLVCVAVNVALNNWGSEAFMRMAKGVITKAEASVAWEG